MITNIQSWTESLMDENGHWKDGSLKEVLYELNNAQLSPVEDVVTLTFPDLPEIQRYADLAMLCIKILESQYYSGDKEQELKKTIYTCIKYNALMNLFVVKRVCWIWDKPVERARQILKEPLTFVQDATRSSSLSSAGSNQTH
ncbi:hypothetical protein ACFL6I_21605 [candidate division KSB1 bacterium]